MKRITCSVLVLSLIFVASAEAKPAKKASSPAPAAPPAAPLPALGPDGKPNLGAVEGQQLFETLGYRFGNGTALNLCGRPSSTIKVTYKDLNGDGFPEAIGSDNDKACYGGPFVTIAYRQRNGVWAWAFRARGDVSVEAGKTQGWLNLRLKTKCDTQYVYDGQRYAQNGYCAADVAGSNLPAALPTPADFDQAFLAANMVKRAGRWTGCADDENGFAQIENGDYRDINQDGVNDIVISDYGGFCYGNTGQGFVIVTKAASGKWQVMHASPGIATFVKTAVKTPGGWPDVEVGGPGFCFPINRWNGKDYVFNRNHEYDKGACKRR